MLTATALMLLGILAVQPSASWGQLFGSSFLSALRGYGSDSCRFVSCPFGQYCLNGFCSPSTSVLGGSYGTGALGYGAGGLFGAANKLCAETVDCYSGQVCQAGRCVFMNGGLYGGVGTAGLLGAPYRGGIGSALDPTLSGVGGYGATSIMPYGGGVGGLYGSPISTLVDRPSGVQFCNLMQDCFNGQICVNGYCSQSNVVYGGSQAFKPLATCATGAVCPVGQYCIGGVCLQNPFTQTTACGNGLMCPGGMYCHLGRCQPTTLYGKKRKRK